MKYEKYPFLFLAFGLLVLGGSIFLSSQSIADGATAGKVMGDYTIAVNEPGVETNELGVVESPYIFALNGQADSEGPVNYDIYASFNRVISGSRTGEGVESVKVILINDGLATSATAVADTCNINLLANNHTCQNIVAISFTVPPSNNRAVMKIDLSPENNYSSVKFEITYNAEAEPTGFTVDIGDSVSNNAWGGDGGHQSNDAEIQIYNTHVSTFGNDDTVGERRLANAGYYVTAGSQIDITVKNNYVAWQKAGGDPQELKPDFVFNKVTTELDKTHLYIYPTLCNNGNADYINEKNAFDLIQFDINGVKKDAIKALPNWQLSVGDCTDDLFTKIPLAHLNLGYNTLLVIADPLNVVEEFNEDNNTLTKNVYYNEPIGITVLTPNGSSKVVQGEPFIITWETDATYKNYMRYVELIDAATGNTILNISYDTETLAGGQYKWLVDVPEAVLNAFSRFKVRIGVQPKTVGKYADSAAFSITRGSSGNILNINNSATDPETGLFVGGSIGLTVGSVDLETGSEAVEITELDIVNLPTSSGNTLNRAIRYVSVYDGSTELAKVVPIANQAHFTLAANKLLVPANTVKSLTIKTETNEITGCDGCDGKPARSSDNWQLQILPQNIKANVVGSSSVVDSNQVTGSYQGNRHYVFKTIPYVDKQSLASYTFFNGVDIPVYKFKLFADPKGDIGFYKTSFKVTVLEDPEGQAQVSQFELYEEPGTSNEMHLTESGGLDCVDTPESNSCRVDILFDTGGDGTDAGGEPRVIPAGSGKVYELRATIFNWSSYFYLDVKQLGDSSVVYPAPKMAVEVDNSPYNNFIWSDLHLGSLNATSTAQWYGGHYIVGLHVPTPTPPPPPSTPQPKPIPLPSVDLINEKAKLLKENKVDQVLAEINELRDTVREQQNEIKYLKSLLIRVKKISDKAQADLNYFITYGVDANTQALGEGERAAAVNSYARAFGALPESEVDLADLFKIANGRFPGKFSQAAEDKARVLFRKVYLRDPDVEKNPNDNAAIKVMTYGLRQAASNRNLESEAQGIETFKYYFGKAPVTTEEWDVMQAITYSGATQVVKDEDNDGLADHMEDIYGTDKSNPDSDGDGHLDGVEAVNGFSPLN